MEEVTNIVRIQFPAKKCTEWYCNYNVSALNNFYKLSSGFTSGNNYALKRFRNMLNGDINGTGGIDGDYDFSSRSNFLYLNNDKKDY
jgi:hypothetical protein